MNNASRPFRVGFGLTVYVSLLCVTTALAAGPLSPTTHTIVPDSVIVSGTAGGRDLVVIDTGLADWQIIARAVSTEADVLTIDPANDGLAQLARALHGRKGIAAIHVMSHGEAGRVQLGSLWLDRAGTADRASELATIGRALGPDGDILLYGCHVAAGGHGIQFLKALSEATGRAVAGSSDLTGAADKRGNWVLESRIGHVGALSRTVADYPGVLANGTITFTNNTGISASAADDGQGGSTDLSGITIRIQNINNNNGTAMGAGLSWVNNAGFLFSNDPTFSAITYVEDFGNVGWRGMSIRSTDGTEFQINSFRYYNWGTTNPITVTVRGYRNGSEVASTSFQGFDPAYNPMTINLDSTFDYVDEVRLTGAIDSWHSINTIVIADAVVPDTTPPTLGISLSDSALIAGETSLVTFTFDEPVTGFANADVTVPNGSLTAVSSSDGGTTWTATFTPTASVTDATNVISVNMPGLTDIAGNPGVGTTSSGNFTIDTARPTASIVVADTALAVGETSLVTVTFSEAVTGFTTGDLTVANGSVASLSSSDGGITWTATLTPTASVTDATNVITLANTGVADAAGNVGTGTTDSNNYAIDTARPTASIVVADTALAIGETSLVTITFSEAVTGFTTGDLTVANGSVASLSSSDGGITWTATLTPTASVTDATNVITLANAGVADASGNTGTGTTDSNNYAIDTVAPTVSSVSVPSNATYVAGQNLDFTINWNENVTVSTTGGTPAVALTIGSTARSATFLAGSTTNALVFRYTVQAGDLDTDGVAIGALSLDGGTITDAVGNSATLTLNSVGSTASVNVDAVAPTVSGRTVPADATYRTTQNLDFTVTHTENVTVNTGGGTPYIAITLDTGGSVQAAYNGGTGTTTLTFRYTVTSGNLDTDGIAVASSITLNGGTIKDASGNDAQVTALGFGSTVSVLVDGVAPTVSTINRQTPSGSTTSATSVVYRVTFAEAVTGVDTADFTVTKTGTADGAVASISGSGAVYDVTVNAVTGSGTLRLDLNNAGTGITDAAGNAITTGYTAGQTYTIDTTAPTLQTVVRYSPTTVHTDAVSATWRVTFQEGVTGVDTADFALTALGGTGAGTVASVTPVSASIYDVTVNTLTGQGALRLDLTATGTGIADLAGNTIADGGFTTGDSYIVGIASVFDARGLTLAANVTTSLASSNRPAQRFTTAAGAPLTLSSVAVKLGSVTATPSPLVTVNENNAGTPGAVVGTLTNPSSLTANALNVWTGSVVLAPGTTYWVVFAETTSSYVIDVAVQTSGGTGSWLTNPDYLFRYGSNSGTTQTGAILLEIGATSVPVITSTLTASGTVDAAFTYTITGSNTPTSFAATGLPAGLSVDTATGEISGTPTEAGSFNVSLTATNGNGTGGASTLVLTVGKGTATVTLGGLAPAYDGTPKAATATTTPTGLTVDFTYDGSSTAPTDAGSYAVVGTVNDADYAGSANATLVIARADQTVTFAPVGTAIIGTPVALSATATSGLPITYSVVSGNGSISSGNFTATDANPVTLRATQSGNSNYNAAFDEQTFTPDKIAATVTLGGLAQTYDGTPRSATAATTPSGLAVAITYDGSATAPTNAGSYAVVATINDATRAGSSGGTLVVAKAGQMVTFSPVGPVVIGTPVVLSATATSGLPITYSVVSGNGSISGGTFTATDANPVTLRATQSGNGNYNAAFDEQTFTPDKIAATVTLGGLAQTYDGTPKSATATTTPAGLTVAITYDGSGIAPTDAGSYAVVATIDDATHAGSASETLVIAKADQTVTFPAVGAVTVGTPVTLSATASSGLPVTFSVVSGDGSISGSQLTVASAATSVVVRATQSGNGNYEPATADQTIATSGITKLPQTITFPQPADRLTSDAAFALSATASSGLTVTFTVQSGPATVSGGIVTPSGAPGTVTVVASQAGNDAYAAASSVTRSFAVTSPAPLTCFGPFMAGGLEQGRFGLNLARDGSNGTLVGFIPGDGGIVCSFSPDASGSFTSTFEVLTAGEEGIVSGGMAAAPVVWTLQGQIQGTTLTATIGEPGITLAATFDPVGGVTATQAGYYLSSTLDTTTGRIHAIVGTTGTVFVLAVLDDLVEGDDGTIDGGSGDVVITLPGGAVIDANVDAPSGTVDGAVVRPADGGTTDFTGLRSDASRTDRLINLSSRARVGAGNNIVITGFVITGTDSKSVLLRAVGPGLTPLGITTALGNPRLRVFQGSAVIAENDDWSSSADALAIADAAARVGAFTLASPGQDAAVLLTLPPGSYTVQVDGAGGEGVALAEIYDASTNPADEYQRLANISTRGLVGAGEDTLVGGFIVTGNAPKRVLVRGVGPALQAFGLTDALADPRLSVVHEGAVIAQNDDWGTGVNTEAELIAAASTTGAFALTSGSGDAALLLTLAPGIYTAQVTPVAGMGGVALIEIYELP